MAIFTRRIRIPKRHRAAVAQIINEITKMPQRGMKTDVYQRGVRDGVELVRKRAFDRGIPLDGVPEPLTIVTEILVDFDDSLRKEIENE